MAATLLGEIMEFTMGSGSHGPSGHVCHDSEGQPLCAGDRGLFFLMAKWH